MTVRSAADLPGFVWRGQVTDRAGRTGVAVSFDDPPHDEQSVLIFDPHTGELYAHELVMMRERRPAVYSLFLQYGYADRGGLTGGGRAVGGPAQPHTRPPSA